MKMDFTEASLSIRMHEIYLLIIRQLPTLPKFCDFTVSCPEIGLQKK